MCKSFADIIVKLDY